MKITGKDLDKTVAGTPVFVAKYADEVEVLKVSRFYGLEGHAHTVCLQERWGMAWHGIAHAVAALQ